MKDFGKTLYQIIHENNLSRKDLAEKIGITPVYLSNLQKRDYFDVRLLEKICRVLGVSPMIFFDDDFSKDCKGRLVGDISNATVIGNATVNVGSEVEHLKELLAEKERIIQILLKQAGLAESIDCLQT